LPDNADIDSRIVPPTIRQEARNHHIVISDRIIFIPGQLRPQNSDNDASKMNGVNGRE